MDPSTIGEAAFVQDLGEEDQALAFYKEASLGDGRQATKMSSVPPGKISTFYAWSAAKFLDISMIIFISTIVIYNHR